MKLYVVYDDGSKTLKDKWFLRYIRDEWEINITHIDLPGPAYSSFLTNRWKEIVRRKNETILKSIKDNLGAVIVWTDIDIQFFGECVPAINELIAGNDFLFQSEHGDINEVNIGFMVIRCSDESYNFWKTVMERVAAGEWDQAAVNDMLRKGTARIRYNILPSKFWATSHHNAPPADIVLHHANDTPARLKGGRLKSSIELKLDDMRGVRRQVMVRRYFPAIFPAIFYLERSMKDLNNRVDNLGYAYMKACRKIFKFLFVKKGHVNMKRRVALFLLFSRQKPIVWLARLLFGWYFERSRTRIELDITYSCNIGCLNCARLLRQAPTSEHMTIEQVKRFIDESVAQKVKWEVIGIVGGEPTLHPDLYEIVRLLLDYKKNYLPDCVMTLFTNGFSEKTKQVLAGLPKELLIENSMKTGPYVWHYPVTLAPCDLKRYRFADYSVGCFVTRICGIALTPFGYYHCPVAGAIDRIFGFDKGRRGLPLEMDSLKDQFEQFCRYCGYFTGLGAKEEMFSDTWIRALEAYKKNKPQLTKY